MKRPAAHIAIFLLFCSRMDVAGATRTLITICAHQSEGAIETNNCKASSNTGDRPLLKTDRKQYVRHYK